MYCSVVGAIRQGALFISMTLLILVVPVSWAEISEGSNGKESEYVIVGSSSRKPKVRRWFVDLASFDDEVIYRNVNQERTTGVAFSIGRFGYRPRSLPRLTVGSTIFTFRDEPGDHIRLESEITSLFPLRFDWCLWTSPLIEGNVSLELCCEASAWANVHSWFMYDS